MKYHIVTERKTAAQQGTFVHTKTLPPALKGVLANLPPGEIVAADDINFC